MKVVLLGYRLKRFIWIYGNIVFHVGFREESNELLRCRIISESCIGLQREMKKVFVI